jgi:hypothetical protein
MMANKVVAMVVMTTPSSQALLDHRSEQETKVKKKAVATAPVPHRGFFVSGEAAKRGLLSLIRTSPAPRGRCAL